MCAIAFLDFVTCSNRSMDAVRANIKDEEELKLAATELLSIGSSLLVENMIEDAVAELIVGVNTDPSFGNYLVIGSGGVLVELVGDSVPLLLPIERQDVIYALSTTIMVHLPI